MRPEESLYNFQVVECSFITTLMQFFMEHMVRSFTALQEPVNAVSVLLPSNDFTKLYRLKKEEKV